MSVILGSIIAFFISWLFYRYYSKQLLEAVRELRNVARFLEEVINNEREVEFKRDAEGKITGLIFNVRVGIRGKSDLKANADVISKKNTEND